MSRITAVTCILVLAVAFVGVHTYTIRALDRDINKLSQEIQSAYQADDWDGVASGMETLQNRWNRSRFWACLTIDTKQIEEIEISLRQSIRYADLRSKSDFIGEFVMFCMLAEHLPLHEGFSAEELL